MSVITEIQEIKRKLKKLSCSEILTTGIVSFGEPVIGCYKLGFNKDTELLWNDNGVWNHINTNGTGVTIANRLISGGIVTWVQDYDYMVSAAVYNIGDVIHTIPTTFITLDPADPNLDRFDLIVVDDTDNVVVITGDPLENPVTPNYDSAVQIPLGNVLVTHNTTQPVVLQEYLYRENIAPWTASSSSGSFDVNSTSSPLVGSKSISANIGIAPGDYIELTDSAKNLKSLGFTALIFKIKAVSNWQADSKIIFQFYNGVTPVPTGSAVTLKTGSYNFDGGNLSDIQNITIPLSAFTLPNTVTKLRITVQYTSIPFTFKLDEIQVQKSVVPFVGNYWYAIGDTVVNNNDGSVNINNITLNPGRTIGGPGTLHFIGNTPTGTNWRFANAVQGLSSNIALVTNETGGSFSGSYSKSHEWFGDYGQKVMAIYSEGFVSIGPNTTPSKMAELDVNSIGRGLLVPRMTTTQRNGIGRRLATVPVTNGGSGYNIAPILTAQNTGGLIAKLHANISGGSVTSITVDQGGSLYNSAPTININNVGTGGIGNPDGSGLVLGTPTVATDTVPTGLLIYNTTANEFQYYDGSTWASLSGGGGGGTGLIGTTTGNDTTDPIELVSNVDSATISYSTDILGNNPKYIFATSSNISGGNSVAIGYQAGLDSTGDNVNAIGTTSAQDNGGNNVIAIGFNAAKNNAGDNTIAIGSDSASGNSESDLIAIGQHAGDSNIGKHLVAIGFYAGVNNSGENVNAFGKNLSGLSNTYNDVNLFGLNALADDDKQTVTNNSVANHRLDFSQVSHDIKQTISDNSGNIFVGYKGSYSNSETSISDVTISIGATMDSLSYNVILTPTNGDTANIFGGWWIDSKTGTDFRLNLVDTFTGTLSFDWTILI